MRQTDPAPALDPRHDRKLLAKVFAQHGRIHIPGALSAASAARVHRCLTNETTYGLVFNGGDKVFDLPPDQVAKMTPAEMAGLVEAAGAGARTGFQYLYESRRLSEAGEAYPDGAHYLAQVVAFLNGEAFLSFAREVTGEKRIAFADAQATKYGPGHFLTTHTDLQPEKKRLAAFVLNMTPNWRPDWGGILLFLDSDGQVAEGYSPVFNALNLLKVPQPHLVSAVSAFAGGHRYSITGWLRAA
ncbi:MAG: 2OG-Fe(II) oxygenase [Alphaproteobacteria bacterium]|nr:2OG-Fe(II) oxygenase [Alphaproteobacteria bacterium]MBV9903711.1 2OG-Fe(II) oxygenase [Alphaproteobacteria bacterium]